MKILNFGSFCIDHVYRVPHFVRPAETLPSLSYTVFAGGKGFNQSLAIARAGGTVAHAGSVGEGGEWLVQRLETAGVDVSRVVKSAKPTGHAVIQLNPSGENAIVLFAGANRSITREQIDLGLTDFGAGDLLLLQNEISEPAYLVQLALGKGMRVVMNPAPMDPVAQSLPLEQLSMIIVNEVEAFDLTGETSPELILDRLAQRMPQGDVVLTLGSQGAMWRSATHRLHIPAINVDVVDTTGAGDTFTGYLIASLAAGLPPDAAMGRAVVAAGLSVTQAGAADSIPDAATVDRVLAGSAV
ncbi:MAG: ribokinase [Gammaproteobacteria bacterium]|nr:ribokinase [Gammaproteobacteria bacterium]